MTFVFNFFWNFYISFIYVQIRKWKKILKKLKKNKTVRDDNVRLKYAKRFTYQPKKGQLLN